MLVTQLNFLPLLLCLLFRVLFSDVMDVTHFYCHNQPRGFYFSARQDDKEMIIMVNTRLISIVSKPIVFVFVLFLFCFVELNCP